MVGFQSLLFLSVSPTATLDLDPSPGVRSGQGGGGAPHKGGGLQPRQGADCEGGPGQSSHLRVKPGHGLRTRSPLSS